MSVNTVHLFFACTVCVCAFTIYTHTYVCCLSNQSTHRDLHAYGSSGYPSHLSILEADGSTNESVDELS